MKLDGDRNIEEGWVRFRYSYYDKNDELSVMYSTTHLNSSEELKEYIDYLQTMMKQVNEAKAIVSISWRAI